MTSSMDDAGRVEGGQHRAGLHALVQPGQALVVEHPRHAVDAVAVGRGLHGRALVDDRESATSAGIPVPTTLEGSAAGRCQETAAGLGGHAGAGSAALADEERGVGMARSGSQSKALPGDRGALAVRRRSLELADEIADAHWAIRPKAPQNQSWQPLPLEHDLDLAHLLDVAALGPFHVERASVADHAQAASGDALDDGGHRRARGARARGLRVPDAALPEADAQLGRRGRNELDVGPPGKKGWLSRAGRAAAAVRRPRARPGTPRNAGCRARSRSRALSRPDDSGWSITRAAGGSRVMGMRALSRIASPRSVGCGNAPAPIVATSTGRGPAPVCTTWRAGREPVHTM